MGNADQPADTRAPETIENEMEATRERLAHTIDELLHRSSPKTIAKREVATVKAYFVDPQGNVRTQNVLKVAAAVGGFVAFVVVARKVTK